MWRSKIEERHRKGKENGLVGGSKVDGRVGKSGVEAFVRGKVCREA